MFGIDSHILRHPDTDSPLCVPIPSPGHTPADEEDAAAVGTQSGAQAATITGTPGRMCVPSQSMSALSSLTQPCETAVPGTPPIP